MKRVIRANRYKDKADQYLQQIAGLGDALNRAIAAETPESLNQAVSNLGKFYQGRDKATVIEGILEEMQWYLKEYKEEKGKSDSFPKVKEDLINYIDTLGFDLYETEGEGRKAAYRLESQDGKETTLKDMNFICRQLVKDFGAKFSEGLGGSWTGHTGDIRGVDFYVGFERDYDLDPQGKIRSLQLQF